MSFFKKEFEVFYLYSNLYFKTAFITKNVKIQLNQKY